jgi:CTP synthase
VQAHPYFIGAQFHPELTSRPLTPQPMFMGLVAAAIARREPGFAQTELGRRWVRSATSAAAVTA